ncbi:MAG: YjjG family noncanonical pyrimidine nucleotidase [Clostridia bacterium]|nr:YjjG family noncanonical pyrimidine nucleotidase [Clostridiales bacterium]MDD7307072.1 YjjG family noncanonical pyrimidine nucleotidase [Eubacteriales bacterium]MDO4352067.1 YjjG family noncanonical pyrimidine nucleotidase [Clostridia bacterium]MDY2933471.1 YjjG family noncanonical pyrimidine nucleotidase [Anaerovoracaceae bacterium]MEE0180739.1 YjjG family noncanonical pyrimidine nucleotidase [Anaerovoracaceae bacterium]
MISTILWDVDGTLLDFIAAEKAAIKTLFGEFNLGQCSDEMIKRYSEINKTYWQRLERGEITKQEVLVGRFKEFFKSEGIDISVVEEFNSLYQLRLGDTIVYHDDSLEIIKSLQGRVRQYVVSNGTVEAQSKKLRLSGLGELVDGIFLSEHIGVEKPNIEFFDKVLEEIKPADRSSILIVGDSLTSDIQGGNNAGIVTCWYNPLGDKAPDKYRIDYEISDLHQIYEIIE